MSSRWFPESNLMVHGSGGDREQERQGEKEQQQFFMSFEKDDPE